MRYTGILASCGFWGGTRAALTHALRGLCVMRPKGGCVWQTVHTAAWDAPAPHVKSIKITFGFCLSTIGATSLTCGFVNDSLCEWGNDLNNWLATWKVEDSALCLKPLRQHFNSKLELLARLYSPFLSEEDAIGCVKFSYIIFISSGRSGSIQQSARLSLMQKQMGWGQALLLLIHGADLVVSICFRVTPFLLQFGRNCCAYWMIFFDGGIF